jgi:hypothetical protein
VDYLNVALRGNGIFEGNVPTDLIARHFTPHSDLDRVKGSILACMWIFW